ncbi:BTAD domain-containing putative transcriptional regulator [Phytohabitans flavus]|uniref:AfsR/SARP family transcriptional regulator n=1 Tax=Phytohabitans flavus TaxID=1076124 RepID=UPI0031EFFDD7
MRVRLLGSIDVVLDGVPRPVSGLRRKAVLAALALQPGEIVSTDRLIDVVWEDAPPRAAAVTLQSHLSHLRRVLAGSPSIVARAPGYLLDLDGGDTDVQVADEMIAQARRSTDPGHAVSLLRAAVALWRDRPLVDLTGLAWFDGQAERLDQVLLRARHALIDARLAAGERAEVIPDLEDLVRQDPHDEPAHGQLMLALYRSGRQSDALAVYQRLRRVLDEDLGIAPSRPIRDLEATILRQEPALDPPPPETSRAAPAGTGVAPAPATKPIPAQLPLAPAGFTGRIRELSTLDSLIPGRDDGCGTPGAVVISAVSGTAGIGKTTLAVHWAHRAAQHFPGGQLYVNLRGYDPSGTVLDPAEALRGFLDAFDVPVDRIPSGVDARAALYRSVLAGRRVLVVLDNARDAEQVRPLLPGTAGCVAVITSRDQLTGLAATEAAHPLTLDLLTATEAHGLLTRRLGAARTAAEPDAVRDIVARCARLPLALAIVAARAAARPGFPLAALADELRHATSTLDALDGGDPATDLRAVFSWSQRTLSPDANQLFRLLGLHPGPDVTAAAAASLAATGPDNARHLLDELARAHLVTQYLPGRYVLHDLLRAYAAEQARTHDGPTARQDATHRLFDHYLRTADAAARWMHPMWERLVLPPARPGVSPEALDTLAAAMAWFTAEHPVLQAAVEQAAATGFDTQAWQLAWAHTAFLMRRSYLDELAAMQHLALDAARRLGDPVGQGYALRGLGLSLGRAGRHEEAERYFERALRTYTRAGDIPGQVHTLIGLAKAALGQGRPERALRVTERALELSRAASDRAGQARCLNGIGWCLAQLGEHRRALSYCTEALALFQQVGDRDGLAVTWDSLGYIHSRLADYGQAVTCYQHAADLLQKLGDRSLLGVILAGLGDVHHAAGDPHAAGKAWQNALEVLDEVGHPHAEQVRPKLAAAAGQDDVAG